MNLADIPLFSMLRSRLGYLNERQKVLAQNIANTDTARYVPEDLRPYSFDAKLQAQRAQMAQTGASASSMAATQAGHMSPKIERKPPTQFRTLKTPDSETTLNGNSVVLEDEMIKMSDSRMSYDAAITFYQKSMNMLRMAARAPGRG